MGQQQRGSPCSHKLTVLRLFHNIFAQEIYFCTSYLPILLTHAYKPAIVFKENNNEANTSVFMQQ